MNKSNTKSVSKNGVVKNGDSKRVVRTTLEPMSRTVDADGIIIDCNEKYAHVIGYNKDDVIGMSVLEHTPPSNGKTGTRSKNKKRHATAVNDHKFSLFTKNGKIFDVLTTIEDAVTSNGKQVMIRSTFLDYKEVRKFQELVRLSKYESLYENSPEMYRTVNVDGIIVDCNQAYETKIGYKKHEIIDRNLTDHTANKSISKMLINMARWRSTNTCTPLES